MASNLFDNLDRQNDTLLIVKEFFESHNNSYFLETLKYVINKEGVGNEYSGCIFPQEIEENEEPFFGVLCWYFEDEIVVSEQEFYDVMLMACQRYIKLNPKTKEEVEKNLSKWKFTES